MACRKTNTILYRIFTFVAIIAVAALSWLAFSFAFAKSARAEDVQPQADGAQPTHDEVFGANHASAQPFEPILNPESSLGAYYLPAGSYYLTEDVQLDGELEPAYIDGVIKLCLHGYTLSNKYYSAIRLAGPGDKLDIYDCGGNENHVGSIRGLIVINGAECNLHSGTIKGYRDSGVSVYGKMDDQQATFNMYGGEISGNGTSGTNSGGGGVCVGSHGIFNMYGGTVCNNSVKKKDGGGVRVGDVSATFHMYGGTITNNAVNFNEGTVQSTIDSYGGAGVYVSGGTFTLEGNSIISGNTKGTPSSQKINNLEMVRSGSCEGKITITGQLGSNAKIGVNMPTGVLTSGYRAKGNTVDPSEYFKSDDGSLSIGFDALNREAEVKTGSVVGGYNMINATATPVAPKVGDTSVTFAVEVTLQNTAGDTTTVDDSKIVTLDNPLHGGENEVTFTYTYNGASGAQNKTITCKFTPDKLPVTVSWSCLGATMDFNSNCSAKYDYDGADIIENITASYTGYTGETVTVTGQSLIVKNESGETVNSVMNVGVYSIYLAASDAYAFGNNSFTLRVIAATVEDGYYKMQSATADGLFGTATVGDTEITVKVIVSLKHTTTEHVKSETKYPKIKLTTPLHVGANTVGFTYEYTDAMGDVQTADLSLTVTATKKQVTVKWYYDGILASGNSVNRLYDGVDVSGKIVAEYDGYDGETKRISGDTALIIKKTDGGSSVTSLSAAGIYKLSLAESTDYVFKNNLFTCTVAESMGDISDFIYEEKQEVILGVSCDEGFEHGTTMEVSWVTDLDDNLVYGTINSALNVSFVNDSVEIAPTGIITVRVLIPDELRDGGNYKIYNLYNGVATQLKFTTDGDYAVFQSSDLSTILFVTEETPPIINPNPNPGGNNEITLNIDGSGLVWLWVILGVIAACVIAITVALIVKFKRDKNKK